MGPGLPKRSEAKWAVDLVQDGLGEKKVGGGGRL